MNVRPFFLGALLAFGTSGMGSDQLHRLHEEPGYYLRNLDAFIGNLEIFEWNQMPGHTPEVVYATEGAAVADRAEGSPHWLSLNGDWRFRYAERPDLIPPDCFRPDFDDRGWDSIPVPANWEMEGYGDPVFRNISLAFEADPPNVPDAYNPTGVYRRSFELPPEWEGRPVFLRMEKVASASFVWVNGQAVGYNEGAHEPAEYNLTPHLKAGRNQITVHVVKYSDGYYMEAQDYWRLAGIFDDVWLYTTPDVHLYDWQAITDLDADFQDAELRVHLHLRHFGDSKAEGFRVSARLLDPDGETVLDWRSPRFSIEEGGARELLLSEPVENPLKWSAEHPHLYRLVFAVLDPQGRATGYLSGRIGFKETHIENQTFFLNGVPLKLNGFNSHMQHPELGHAMDEATMRTDLEILKRFNINSVRTSHYPPHRRYLELADEYGMYIIDEAGVEAHATESISEDPRWEPMYRERVRQMVLRDRNHASVLFWSAGNESGEGENICAVIDEGRKLDPTRSWMYGGNAFAHPCEDIIGPRYPTPFELRNDVALVSEAQDARPSYMDEYLSVAGNGGGGMDEYWDVIRAYPRLSGGALWDLVSPGLSAPVRALQDGSTHSHPVHMLGRPTLQDGYRGRGLDLNGHDQWVEVYRAPALDLASEGLTIAAWVYPRVLENSSNTFISKGSWQFGLRQVKDRSLEAYLTTGERHRIEAPLPADWFENWHHVAAVYDGARFRLFIDGEAVAETPVSGRIQAFPFPIQIGRDAQAHGQDTWEFLCNARVDEVGIFDRPFSIDALMQEPDAAREQSLLWLDFERVETKGSFYTYGNGARTYGSFWPDRTVQPEMWQFKKSGQPVEVSWSDDREDTIRITNRFHFSSLSAYPLHWQAEDADGAVLAEGSFRAEVAPQETASLSLPEDVVTWLRDGRTRFLRVSTRLPEDTTWAKAGHELAWNQLPVSTSRDGPKPRRTAVSGSSPEGRDPALRLSREADRVEVSGQGFAFVFDASTGLLRSVEVAGTPVLRQGPRLNVWRAPLANDLDQWAGYFVAADPGREGFDRSMTGVWHAAGLDQAEGTLEFFEVDEHPDGVELFAKRLIRLAGSPSHGFTSAFRYRISADGQLTIDHEVIPHGNLPGWLPRMGTEWRLAPTLQTIEWYGRGPEENYPDRRSGYPIGRYERSLDDFYEPYLIPQDHGLRTEVRWTEFRDDAGRGVRFEMEEAFNFNAYPFSTDNLTRANYPFQLERADFITVNLDYATSGVGCTARSVFNPYRVLPEPRRQRITMVVLPPSE